MTHSSRRIYFLATFTLRVRINCVRLSLCKPLVTISSTEVSLDLRELRHLQDWFDLDENVGFLWGRRLAYLLFLEDWNSRLFSKLDTSLAADTKFDSEGVLSWRWLRGSGVFLAVGSLVMVMRAYMRILGNFSFVIDCAVKFHCIDTVLFGNRQVILRFAVFI